MRKWNYSQWNIIIFIAKKSVAKQWTHCMLLINEVVLFGNGEQVELVRIVCGSYCRWFLTTLQYSTGHAINFTNNMLTAQRLPALVNDWRPLWHGSIQVSADGPTLPSLRPNPSPKPAPTQTWKFVFGNSQVDNSWLNFPLQHGCMAGSPKSTLKAALMYLHFWWQTERLRFVH